MDDDWLEDDVGLKARRRQKKRARSDLPTSSHNFFSSPKSRQSRGDSISINTSFRLPETVAFDPTEAFCSTQVESRVPPQSARNPGPSTSSKTSVSQQYQQSSGASQPTQLPSSPIGGIWCTIKVNFSDISLLLPVDSQ